MQVSFWVKINGKQRYPKGPWYPGAVSASKYKPAAKSTELAFKLEVDVPDSFFERPELVAKIEIPGSSPRPPAVSSEIMERVADELTKQTGFRVTVAAAAEEPTT